MSEAKKYNIRLILSLVNNWNDYGGKAQYVKWGKDSGSNVSSDDDFFSDPLLKIYYKNHIKASFFLLFLLFFLQSLTLIFCICTTEDGT